MQQPSNRKKHQQKILIKKRKRILITSLVAVVLFIVSVAATLGIYSWLNPEIDLFAWMHPVQKTEEGEEVPVLKERFNLLVLGVDERLDVLGR